MQKINTWNANGEPLANTVNVSDEWHDSVVTAFPGIERMTEAQVAGSVRDLLKISHLRSLTSKEEQYIRALDAVRNLNATVKALGRRDVNSVYGETVPMDSVKFTHWSPDTCGCQVSYMWRIDHGGEGQPQREHHPHVSHVKCDQHAHLADMSAGKSDHHDEVLAHNMHKNGAVDAVATALEVHVREVAWAYDENRNLVVSHAALTPDKAAEVRKAVDSHPIASKRPVVFG